MNHALATACLKVIDPGLFTTVQDRGRFGYRRFGVPASGPMDNYASCAANVLLGNDLGATILEFGHNGPTLEVVESGLIAVTGARVALEAQGRRLPTWTALFVRRGWMIRLTSDGGWGYLAMTGGIAWPTVLGSPSTYLRGGLGRRLAPGEALTATAQGRPPLEMAGRHIPPSQRPPYGGRPTVLHVIPGPQWDRFNEEGQQTFLSSEYAISPLSDRMGYRLDGPAIVHRSGADIISDGLVPGSVQVPASGQPIVMMSDCPTTGGYTKIATVIGADLPLLAQCPIGSGRVRFRPTTVEAAQERYRETMDGLRMAIEA
jgi:antagonist of KipI